MKNKRLRQVTIRVEKKISYISEKYGMFFQILMYNMCWNIRGFNHPSKHIEVRNVLLSNKVNVCGILETKVSINDIFSVCRNVMSSWNFIHNGNANQNIRALGL